MSQEPARTGPSSPDLWTLIAIAVVAYAVSDVAHEGLGHGGACILAGGRPAVLATTHFVCDETGLSPAATASISAAGTVVNLALGGLALALLGSPRPRGSGRYFLWLLMTINLLQGAGYWLFSGAADIGDWAHVIGGLEPRWGGRAGLIVAGAAGYWAAIQLSLGRLLPFLGPGEDRRRRAWTLCLVPYVTGAALFVLAGLPNPVGFVLVLVSSAAASLGGTSALAWMTQLLRNERRFPPSARPPIVLGRSPAWLALGVLTALAFVIVLGPSIRF